MKSRTHKFQLPSSKNKFIQSNTYRGTTAYVATMSVSESIVSQVEDLDVIPNERHLSELNAELSSLQSQLAEYEKELAVKQRILDKFQAVADKYKEEEKEKPNKHKGEEKTEEKKAEKTQLKSK